MAQIQGYVHTPSSYWVWVPMTYLARSSRPCAPVK